MALLSPNGSVPLGKKSIVLTVYNVFCCLSGSTGIFFPEILPVKENRRTPFQNTKRVFLAHGDNMKIDHLPVLRFMNAVFRSKTIRFLFSWLVHPDWAMRFGQWWSGKSRKSHLVSEMGDHITDPLIEYAREYAGAERPDYFIFGHMHQPRDYSEGNLRVLCLGEWHSDPVYAVIDSEGNASLKKY